MGCDCQPVMRRELFPRDHCAVLGHLRTQTCATQGNEGSVCFGAAALANCVRICAALGASGCAGVSFSVFWQDVFMQELMEEQHPQI
jgi:hypothetical protein